MDEEKDAPMQDEVETADEVEAVHEPSAEAEADPIAAIAASLTVEAQADAVVEEPVAEVTKVLPEPAPKPEPAETAPLEAMSPVRIWPAFLVYLLAWCALAGATVAVLMDAARAQRIVVAPAYPYFLYGAIGLAAFGPVLGLWMWAAKRTKVDAAAREGLLTTYVTWGLLSAFVGVALWWAGLDALDLVAAGRIG